MELTELNLKNNESIFIKKDGSIEVSIRVWNHEGVLRIEGPINKNHEAVIITRNGIEKTKPLIK